MRHQVLVSLAASLAVACSAESPTPAAPLAVEQLAEAYPRAMCENLLACSGRLRVYVPDVATCASALASALGFRTLARMPIETLTRQVRAGALRYDPAAARACVEQLTSGCYPSLSDRGTPAACRRAFVGAAPIGGPCAVSAECGGDAWCSTRDDRGDVCPGECTTRVALGETCERSAQCPVAASPDAVVVCASPTGQLQLPKRCLTVRLDAPAALGQPCGRRAGTAEERTTPCAPGLWCRSRVCAAPIALGAECASEFDECAGGGLCVGPIQGTKRCVPVAVRTAVGEPCDLNVSEPTQAQATCDARRLACVRGACVAVAEAAAGAPCGTDATRCAAGLTCLSSERTCAAPGPPGAPCSADAACQSQACDAATRTCAPLACE